jgi:hypothetical protein
VAEIIRCSRRLAPIVAALALSGLACGHASPSAPTPVTSGDRIGQPALAGGLTVSRFSLTGWKDQRFHYLPVLSVTLAPDAQPVSVQQIDLTAVIDGRTQSVGGVKYGLAKALQPGDTLDLTADQSLLGVTMMTDQPLGTVTVTVSYVDGAGAITTATATAQAPEVSDGSIATLAIRSFTVSGWTEGGWFQYWPRLTLAETSGASRAIIKQMVFELTGTGSAGRVPVVWNPAEIAAGGTITLDEDGYGGPWLAISSQLANAARVSVVISYVDNAGRGASISAVADVSR